MHAEEDANPPKVVMILSAPFSGSTLLAALLGNASKIENLGEAAYLANDYYQQRTCTCGQRIDACQFWLRVFDLLESDKANGKSVIAFSDEARAHKLDARRRGFVLRLGTLLAISVKRLISKRALEDYVEASDGLFRAAQVASGSETVVDSSKSLLRADVLISESKLRTFVIFLSRTPIETYAARIKRARRRNQYYFQVFAIAYLLRLRLMSWSLRRLRRRADASTWIELQFDALLNSPERCERKISDMLGQPVSFQIGPNGTVNISEQHGFAGNVWRSRQGEGSFEVKLDPDRPKDPLTLFERMIFKVFGGS